ncbi:LysR family transcriptional regulator [uncultured Tateyamaria sp.]|uniref:LysR family transcriptional regulator n=1 Tax=uncultured Tateyamaria sp. TaxID=455651 RepID=UPI00261A13DD|nr:LysR family transcriptional regulator [uncultured Tateyamaria sp.]
MINKLRSIAIFSTVVDQGTFRAAATHLGLAPSRVSEVVSELEKDLGVTLLYRSTRQLSLTHEGQQLHARALEMLRAAEDGLDAVSQTSSEPAGALRVTAPAYTTQTALMDTIAGFAKRYPKIDLSFDFSDKPRELIRDGFDVGIRAGWLKDSELLTRNIGHADRLVVAHPDYIAARGLPEHPSDLERWDWVRFSLRPATTEMTSKTGEVATVLGQSSFAVNSADALYEFATRGLGVTVIPENMAHRGIERGDLQHLLPEWTVKPLGLHAVWPNRTERQSVTQLFVRYLAEHGEH